MVTIREIGQRDISNLHRFAIDTFVESFAHQNTQDNMDAYIAEHKSFDKLKAEIERPESVFYVAMIEEEIVGYLKINWGHAQTELQDTFGMEIERIYVSKNQQGKKIGQMLMEKAKEIAIAKNKAFIWLGVWEKNEKAIAFYTKLGFRAFSTHPFFLGSDLQTDIMMRIDVNV